ncbi:hypothetical protein EDB86DRAFT_2214390 [Lactarius hatsudake]|nr:hypothetical protein EDB86DRAFT_2214390 [Lactarius hatsudake]
MAKRALASSEFGTSVTKMSIRQLCTWRTSPTLFSIRERTGVRLLERTVCAFICASIARTGSYLHRRSPTPCWEVRPEAVYTTDTYLVSLSSFPDPPSPASVDRLPSIPPQSPLEATSPMSQTSSTAVASSRFQAIFNAALKSYEKQTKNDLLAHPLASQFLSCDSTSAITAILQDQVQEFDRVCNGDERLTKWLNPTVNVLYAFSATLGEGVGLVFSPAKVIFAGIGVFLLAAKDVAASKDTLAELFDRMGYFFKRLETYTEVTPTAAMTDIITKILVEVLRIFGIATKELRRGSAKKFLKKLAGRTDLEDAMKRLDNLTQEEARMALAEVLKVTRNVRDEVKVVDGKVQVVIDGERGVSNQSPIPTNIHSLRQQRGKSGGEGSNINYSADSKQYR